MSTNNDGTQNGTTTDNRSRESQNRVELKRSLGLWNGVSMIIGVIVGSGIFVSPKGVLEESGSVGASLLVWSACGFLALLGALCFAELGTSILSSGGEYTYIKLAYGSLPSFLYIWVLSVVIIPCSNAISALTFANYVLQPLYTECEPPPDAIRFVALAILFALVYVNCVSVDNSVRLQNSFTLAKVLALVLIIVYGAYYLFAGKAVNFETSETIWSGTQTSLPHLAKAFYAGFYTFAGWNCLNCVTEEIKDPVRNLPRAIIISITSVTLIYILANAAYFAVLTKQDILLADAIAVLFGRRAIAYAQWLMPLAVALSTMSGLNANIFASSRIFFAGARQGQLFSALHMVNVNNMTPIPSLLFLGLISSMYLFTTQILLLINYMVFVEATFAALGVSTVLVLRYKLPNQKRPLKIPAIIPILYLLFSLLLLILPLWSSPFEASIGILILLTGLPVYYATAHWKVKPECYQNVLDRFNEIVQKLTMSVVPTSDLKLDD